MKNNQGQNTYALDLVILPNDKIEQFNEFVKQYGNLPDKYIFREIAKVKNEISSDMLQQHVKRLDSLSKVEGFVTDYHKQRIDMVKRILASETKVSQPKSQQQAGIETQFWTGSSLLLWFLLLTAIWRRPFFRRPYFGYPYIY